MRLLYTLSDGTLRWTKDIIRSEEIPPYAILSHTWGEQEVIFDNLKSLDNVKDVVAKKEADWNKIHFCARQAERDGLDYFWVDTCCIDKANNTELSKAINSMFRWYQNAEKCYVFLADVGSDTLEANGESPFRQSRWFNRGWTLQELLAPHSVEFFSEDRGWLGDKESLKHTIHEVTGIPFKAPLGSDMSEFDVAERFSWAANRQTTEEEDGAGRSHDQEEKLVKICSWLSAPDPSTNYHKTHKRRQAKTGLWLLESAKFAEWKERAASRLWLYGIPGCGKTILSSTIIEHLLQHCHDDTSMVTAYF
ncbi:HET domain-containing protein [Pyrenophora tritici-repentis]|uniref:HET domain containing protein n=1 Tax=Pyrenophora tritici-repentis TaxID=45151 RepID=A0A2W1FXV2_9PLEO|nr:HET domain-containing protein [Pyrenophora tritici-repentis]KAF7445688.1 HET domain containing protein [Pyrenophora tritici-repentis]KAF7565989.1 HET domain containing protein [Pyrenophora tritici-repentis]KAI1509624.1 Heterokaryon incompatibility protein [Pyrenophora tritici-repentis]KAI1524030.1 HET domain containing protein [Pyrenophora tritici-repentis]